jgi:hypothetical protein
MRLDLIVYRHSLYRGTGRYCMGHLRHEQCPHQPTMYFISLFDVSVTRCCLSPSLDRSISHSLSLSYTPSHYLVLIYHIRITHSHFYCMHIHLDSKSSPLDQHQSSIRARVMAPRPTRCPESAEKVVYIRYQITSSTTQRVVMAD